MSQLLFFASILISAAAFFAMNLGMIVALRADGIVAYSLSSIGAAIVLCLLVATRKIWEHHDSLHKVLRIFWALAVFCALSTISFAVCRNIIMPMPILSRTSTGQIWRIDWLRVFQADYSLLIANGLAVVFLCAGPVATMFLKAKIIEESSHET